jgi:hypothetical protein
VNRGGKEIDKTAELVSLVFLTSPENREKERSREKRIRLIKSDK